MEMFVLPEAASVRGEQTHMWPLCQLGSELCIHIQFMLKSATNIWKGEGHLSVIDHLDHLCMSNQAT